jgi:predicted lipoprotein with Yx(FWY)xxD motif
VTAAVLAVLVTALAGCTSGAGAPEPVVTGVPTAVPAKVSGLFALGSSTLGPVVVDGQGYVLYRSDRDSAHPPRSTCTDACLAQWLPVRATAGDLQIAGIDRELVGRLTRSDGTVQLTLAGWPLYGFAGDRMPGDVNGQGTDGVWHVIAPSGAKAP